MTARDRLSRRGDDSEAGEEEEGSAALEQFYAIRRFQPTLTFTPDGRKLLFSADISGQFNLWRIPFGVAGPSS